MIRRTLSSGLLALLCALPASASLVMETWTRTSLQLTNLGRAEASATATGLATLHTSSSTSSHLDTVILADSLLSMAALNLSTPISEPASFQVTALALTSIRGRPDLQGGGILGNISGAIATGAGLSPNTIPSTGQMRFCLVLPPLPPCVAQLPLPVGATSGGLQVGMGVGGVFTLGGTGTAFLITLAGAPYTVGSVSVVNRTQNGGLDLFAENGFAHGPASLTSSTAQTSGVLQLLTATRTTFNATPGLRDVSGTISRTLVHFVPEPSRGLLFGLAALGAAWLGGARARRHAP